MNKIAACVLIQHSNLSRVLFLGVSRKDNPNAFGLPGGKQEPGETLKQTAIRELREETGVIIDDAVPFFKSIDEEGWETTVFLPEGKIVYGPLPESGEGVVSWISREKLLAGPFGKYMERFFYEYDSPDYDW